MLRYSITIFLSAFLLFQVQPLIAKIILPWFGGTSAVWTTSMVFFQIALLLGYLYAHLLRVLFSPKLSWMLHSAVSILILLTLPVVPAESLKPDGSENLTLAVVHVLLFSVAAPFFLLSTTGPLIQAWQSSSHPDKSPYRLYALSNIGSLLALISYPFVFEPLLPLAHQSFLWSAMFALFVLCCGVSGWQLRNVNQWHASPTQVTDTQSDTDASASNLNSNSKSKSKTAHPAKPLAWLFLAMIPSIMLIATTSLMCQEIASVPFLWILPLATYLITFIICFEKPNWYRRGIFIPLLAIAGVGAVVVKHLSTTATLPIQVGTLALALFAVAMVCHGELEKSKPNTSRLTLFYLLVSAGGSLGGITAVVIAPRLLPTFLELHITILLAIFVATGIPIAFSRRRSGIDWAFAAIGLIAGGAVLASLISTIDSQNRSSILYSGRNEYGIFSVQQDEVERIFISGNTDHGGQRVAESERFIPYGYYCSDSGFGVAISAMRQAKDQQDGLRVGVIGLGVGSMLSWAGENDQFDFFEINPAVEDIARNWFDYLEKYQQQIRVFIGDGRIQLERQTSQPKYDLLAVDAFSSDSIPVHLLTQECFDVYLDRINESGIIIFHISNKFIDLKPVIFTAAKEKNLDTALIKVDGTEKSTDGIPKTPSTWILVGRPNALKLPLIQEKQRPPKRTPRSIRWTDDYTPIAPLVDTSIAIDWKRIFESNRKKKKKKKK